MRLGNKSIDEPRDKPFWAFQGCKGSTTSLGRQSVSQEGLERRIVSFDRIKVTPPICDEAD